MSVIGSNALAGASGAGAAAAGFQIDRSLRFNDDDSAYLSKVFASAGDRQKWTWSGWAKRSTANNTTNQLFYAETSVSAYTQIGWSGDNFQLNIAYNGTTFATIRAAAESRDVSAWAHYVVVYDSANATSTDRMILYINGTRVTDFATSSFPTQNALSPLNANTTHYIGTRKNVNQYFDGYLAEVHFVDGQALAPTDFGEFDADTGVWNPIEYSGTYNTNGFYLNFSNNTSTTTIAEDSSGNGNDWTANNISVTAGADNDSLIDSPMNYTATSGNNGGNYCTLNPLTGSGSGSLTNGNLSITTSSNAWVRQFPTIMPKTGKWYVECLLTNYAFGSRTINVGVAPIENTFLTGKPGSQTDEIAYEAQYGRTIIGGSNDQTGLTVYTSNSIIGVAIDFDNRNVQFYLDNSALGNSTTFPSASKDYTFIMGCYGSNAESFVNFGQRPFAYTPPTGFKSLCTQNLDDPTIADPSTAMDATLYTGNGSTQSITGLNFASAPDLVWIKNRTNGNRNVLTDSVRGVTKEISSDQTSAEITRTNGLTAFNSDGFSLGSWEFYNNNGNSYVAWSWDGGTSTVTNTDGTHSAQVRANSSTGFSISTHSRTTAASISTWGHGLGAAPEFVILKPYSGTYSTFVWHKSLGNNKRFYMNGTGNATTYGFDVWSSDSTTIGVYGTIIAGGGTALDCVAYAWAPIEGYSKFGFYEGNGSATAGPFVYTGFTPKVVTTRNIDSNSNWNVWDTSRSPYNLADQRLRWSGASSEDNTADIDILSNGFKIRDSTTDINTNGNTFIYCAWAENPFKTARAR